MFHQYTKSKRPTWITRLTYSGSYAVCERELCGRSPLGVGPKWVVELLANRPAAFLMSEFMPFERRGVSEGGEKNRQRRTIAL